MATTKFIPNLPIMSSICCTSAETCHPPVPASVRAEFGSSRECSKQLTRVPVGGVATLSYSHSNNGDNLDKPREKAYSVMGQALAQDPPKSWDTMLKAVL